MKLTLVISALTFLSSSYSSATLAQTVALPSNNITEPEAMTDIIPYYKDEPAMHQIPMRAASTPETLGEKDTFEKGAISRYQDIYFLFGNPDSKAQLSFKLRPFGGINLFITYTQRLYWQLQMDSKPFKDVNYSPELLYSHRWSDSVETPFGLHHHSNGKDGLKSRSYDDIFAQINHTYINDNYRIKSAVRYFRLYDIDKATNPDIENYLGHFVIGASFDGVMPKLFGSDGAFEIEGAPSSQWDMKKGYVQVTLKFGLKLAKILPQLIIQGFYGYGESLISYDHFERNFRVGFVF